MAESEEVVMVQLATRIPKVLHRELRLYCVEAGTSVMGFVTKAIEEKLSQPSESPGKAGKRRGRAPR